MLVYPLKPEGLCSTLDTGSLEVLSKTVIVSLNGRTKPLPYGRHVLVISCVAHCLASLA